MPPTNCRRRIWPPPNQPQPPPPLITPNPRPRARTPAAAAAPRPAAAQGAACPKWGAPGQGVTSADRPAVEPSVFQELSEAELNQVIRFLGEKLGTAPVQYDEKALYRNFIHGAWLEVPPKDEVLNHLDRGGPKPVRKARAVVVMGAKDPPYVMDVVVSPLPNPTKWEPANVNATTKQLPFVMRPHSGADIPGQVYLLSGLAKTLKTFLWEAFGAAYGDGCEPNCIYDNYANIGYLSPEVPRALWLWFVKPIEMQGDGNFLHPLPLQVAIAQNGAGRRRVRFGACLLAAFGGGAYFGGGCVGWRLCWVAARWCCSTAQQQARPAPSSPSLTLALCQTPQPPPTYTHKHTGQNIADWKIIQVWFNGNFFSSAEALAAEWAKPASPLRRNKMKFPSEPFGARQRGHCPSL